ncbi:MAG: DUF262 domain-containing protein [Spirochaetales bacterium]|nr:DUF262 domain-containing protein [Spirochaetales bacterium]
MSTDEQYIGIDNEDTDPEKEKDNKDITSPFDPKKIKITVEPGTVYGLIERIKHDEIDMNTEFQRMGNLWDHAVQSRLIESLLLRFPLPAFYFDATNENNWLIIDGLQRLWTFKNFIIDKENPLRLKSLEILGKGYQGKTYDELHHTMTRRILETQVTYYLIQPGTPKNVKYNVFKRINTGGLSLNAQEIRHALNQGFASDFLMKISEDERFKKFIKIKRNRMEDRELILRYIAYMLNSYEEYKKPMSTFLDNTMEKLSTIPEIKAKEIENALFNSLEIAYELFGKHLFSRSIVGGKRNLNRALFEVWTSEIARLSPAEWNILLKNKTELIKKYKSLLETNETFVTHISVSTSAEASVNNRFKTIHDLIKGFIQ